ncbi:MULTISPECIES: YkvA family protein [Flammeovirga]|nr:MULTISPECIES: YkvA family protein [Flammeovirga]
MKIKDIDTKKYVKGFQENQFLEKLINIAKKAGEKVVYIGLVLFFMYIDTETPKKAKVAIAGALGYLLIPFDLIPDFIPIVGYSDDFSVVLAAASYVAVCLKEEHLNLAVKKMEEWFDDFEASEVEGLNAMIYKKEK